MLTTKYIKDDLKIFMNRKCNNSFVILCVREKGKKDKTAMLRNWDAALDLIKEWAGLELTRADFEEDNYVYEKKPIVTEAERNKDKINTENTPSLFRNG